MNYRIYDFIGPVYAFLQSVRDILQVTVSIDHPVEDTARYAGFTSSSCGGLRPPAEAFFALFAVLAYFRPFFMFSSNLSNF